jgi:nicotinamide riboside transporter PnuC
VTTQPSVEPSTLEPDDAPPASVLTSRNRPLRLVTDARRTRRTGPPRAASWFGTPLLVTCVVIGLVVWALALPSVEPYAAGGWGLAQILPPATWVGTILVVGAWAAAIVRRQGGPALRVGGLFATIAVLYGLQPATEPLPRTTTVWLHLGFVQRFAETGQTAQGIDARFSWPGMFAGWGFLERAARVTSLVAIANWHPVAIAVLFAGLTLAVARRLGADPRRAWLAVAIVMVSNWIEQDYFSPQGQFHLVSLLIFALVIPLPGRRTSPVAIGIVLVLTGALVVSHQLSPALLALQLIVLAVAERRAVGRWGLPAAVAIVVACAEVAWLSFGAREFWTGQLPILLDGFGQVGSTVSKNLGGRLSQGDPGLLAVRGLRLAMAAILLSTAVAGSLLSRRRGRPWVLLPALGLVPWLVVPLQSYGGELFMRCLLFGLPFLALASAELLVPADARGASVDAEPSAPRARVLLLARDTPRPLTPEVAVRSAGGRRALAAGLVLAVSACALIVARGGNDGFYVYSPAELATATFALDDTPAGGLLFMPLEQGPVRTDRIGEIRIGRAADLCPDVSDAVLCVGRDLPDRVLVTASMQRMKTLQDDASPQWSADFVSRVEALGYHVLRVDAGGTVLARTVGHTTYTPPAPSIQTPMTPGAQAELVLLALGLLVSGAALVRGRRRLWLLALAVPMVMVAVFVAQVVKVATS